MFEFIYADVARLQGGTLPSIVPLKLCYALRKQAGFVSLFVQDLTVELAAVRRFGRQARGGGLQVMLQLLLALLQRQQCSVRNRQFGLNRPDLLVRIRDSAFELVPYRRGASEMQRLGSFTPFEPSILQCLFQA